VSSCCLAPAIKRPISVHLLVSVGTTFRTDSGHHTTKPPTSLEGVVPLQRVSTSTTGLGPLGEFPPRSMVPAPRMSLRLA
jgi:hypothetical protein